MTLQNTIYYKEPTSEVLIYGTRNDLNTIEISVHGNNKMCTRFKDTLKMI